MKGIFKENLLLLRKRKGLTQPEFGKLIGIKIGQVSKYERGVSKPNVDLLIKMSEVLECSLDELAGK